MIVGKAKVENGNSALTKMENAMPSPDLFPDSWPCTEIDFGYVGIGTGLGRSTIIFLQNCRNDGMSYGGNKHEESN